MHRTMRYLTLASAPALALFRVSPADSARKGTILFYHGFGASKENYAPVLSQFAEAGFLAIGIDGVGHGERRFPDFNERFPPFEPHLARQVQLEAAFLEVVRATVREVPLVIDALIECRWAYPEQIGIAGISFGGLITYAAVVSDRRIQAAVPVVGSPQWKLPWPDSPHLHSDRFYPTALLSQVAAQDTNQSPDNVRAFHRRLTPYYAQTPERLHYVEFPDSGHDLSQEVRDMAWNAATNWFDTFLSSRSM